MIVIERFEGNIAVLEDIDCGKLFEVDIKFLPRNAKEGDVVELKDGLYTVNKEKTSEIRRSIVEKLRKMGL
ncbi:MAG: DUF3006 domain-containing protein [Oscillospiraceae bacterium]|nr:DUF3006 domain-containing protein [Oscillospiraceae bacterium]